MGNGNIERIFLCIFYLNIILYNPLCFYFVDAAENADAMGGMDNIVPNAQLRQAVNLPGVFVLDFFFLEAWTTCPWVIRIKCKAGYSNPDDRQPSIT